MNQKCWGVILNLSPQKGLESEVGGRGGEAMWCLLVMVHHKQYL